MSISLSDILKPSEVSSSHPTQQDWAVVESRLGFKLPEDYKSFIKLYGAGCINDFMYVLNPFSENSNLNLLEQGLTRIQALKDLVSHYGNQIPYEINYSKLSIHPWGFTDNGDVLYWKLSDSAEDYVILVGDDSCETWLEYKISTTDFLAAVLKNSLSISIFPDDVFVDEPRFQSL